MKLPVLSIDDVVGYQLCCGCGACAYIDPDSYTMVDVPSVGRRPMAHNGCGESDERDDRALGVCPGIRLDQRVVANDGAMHRELLSAWGPVYDVWEGYATDPEIRYRGSSGGAVTALALYCLEKRGMHGVLHVASHSDRPLTNTTVMSRSRSDLLAGAGSRYAPASPCEELKQIETAPAECVFIGKPCDIAAVQRSRQVRPALDRKLGLTIGFFCAGTPSTEGTVKLLKSVGVEDPSAVTSLRYRGHGWPGRWTVRWTTPEGERESSLSYDESWSFLQKHRQWRCYICPDHTGEFADVAVGDPWDRPRTEEEAGTSLIVARTPRGRMMLEGALQAGYLKLRRVDPLRLPSAQPNLLKTRGALWGRLLVLRLLRVPSPKYRGFPTWRFWLSALSVSEKKASLLGTVKRVFTKKLRARLVVRSHAGSASPSPLGERHA